MAIDRLPITTREEWLTWRKSDVTASVVAALFDLHPYQTPLGLYLEKSGFDMPQPDNAVLRRGRLLEGAVAQAVAEEKPDWLITKASDYLRDTEARLGCTTDFLIAGDPRGKIVLQAKTVAPMIYRRDWTDDSPPFYIVLQTAQEAMLEDAALGVIAALEVDPWRLDLHLYEVPRHDGTERKIREAAAKFWDDVAAKREPKADFARDGELITMLYRSVQQANPSNVIDLRQDNRIYELLEELERVKAEIKIAEEAEEKCKTEIKAKLAGASAAILTGWRLTHKIQHKRGHYVNPTSFPVLRAGREKTR